MVVEIAIGVALGIVLGVVALRYWRQILSSSILVIAALLFLGILVWLGFYFWEKRSTIAVYAGAALGLAVLYGLPFYIYGRLTRAYPEFNALLKGEAPWTGVARLPLRLLVMSLFALMVAGAGVGALFGSVWLVEYASKLL
jgi:hypothetical protein